MLDKLNPFKKGHKEAPKENDRLAPTKSTKSLADSVRSFGDKAEHFFQEGQRPNELVKDKEVSGQMMIPPVSTAGGLQPQWLGKGDGASKIALAETGPAAQRAAIGGLRVNTCCRTKPTVQTPLHFAQRVSVPVGVFHVISTTEPEPSSPHPRTRRLPQARLALLCRCVRICSKAAALEQCGVVPQPMTDSRVQSAVATALRLPLLVGRPLVRQARTYVLQPVVARVAAVFAQLRALTQRLRAMGRCLAWAVLLPVLALSLAGLVTGFVFGLVLARISVVLEVFPTAGKSTKVVSEIASPKAKKKVLIQVSPGQPGQPGQLRTITDTARADSTGSLYPSSSPGTPYLGSSPRAYSYPNANSYPNTYSHSYSGSSGSNSFSGTKSYPVSPFSAGAYAAQLDAGIHKAFPSSKQSLTSRAPSTPPESAWETEDDLSHSDEDLADETVGPSQIEFYSQFRLPGVHDPGKGRHMADDAFGDGYKTPPARVRTPPSRSPRLVRIREDTEA